MNRSGGKYNNNNRHNKGGRYDKNRGKGGRYNDHPEPMDNTPRERIENAWVAGKFMDICIENTIFQLFHTNILYLILVI